MFPAPIALFVYNRLAHTKATIAALQKNKQAQESELYVFSDGPKSSADAPVVAELREYLKSVSGFKKVTVIARPHNVGLAHSIISGVTDILAQHDRVIVLEDDLVTSPYFLQYMNDALELYDGDARVVSVHGYCYPVSEKLPDTFFVRGADCWGWATWQRGWDVFEPNGAKLLQQIYQKKLTRAFDWDGAYPYTNMLQESVWGYNDSWAIRWHASAFLADRLTLYPGTTLVQNIGFDRSGTHSGHTNYFAGSVSAVPIHVERIPIEQNTQALALFRSFFTSWRMRLVTTRMRLRTFIRSLVQTYGAHR